MARYKDDRTSEKNGLIKVVNLIFNVFKAIAKMDLQFEAIYKIHAAEKMSSEFLNTFSL